MSYVWLYSTLAALALGNIIMLRLTICEPGAFIALNGFAAGVNALAAFVVYRDVLRQRAGTLGP